MIPTKISILQMKVSSIQDEGNLNNNIIKDKRKNYSTKSVPTYINGKPTIMMLIVTINRVTKITIIITIKIHRTIV